MDNPVTGFYKTHQKKDAILIKARRPNIACFGERSLANEVYWCFPDDEAREALCYDEKTAVLLLDVLRAMKAIETILWATVRGR